MRARRISRGVVLSSKLRSFLAEHTALVGLKRTGERLGIRPATVRALLDGYRSEIRTSLKILGLMRFLGADRQTWCSQIPQDAPPRTREYGRRVVKVAPPEPKQRSLF